jgi:hypothetical protein
VWQRVHGEKWELNKKEVVIDFKMALEAHLLNSLSNIKNYILELAETLPTLVYSLVFTRMEKLLKSWMIKCDRIKVKEDPTSLTLNA